MGPCHPTSADICNFFNPDQIVMPVLADGTHQAHEAAFGSHCIHRAIIKVAMCSTIHGCTHAQSQSTQTCQYEPFVQCLQKICRRADSWYTFRASLWLACSVCSLCILQAQQSGTSGITMCSLMTDAWCKDAHIAAREHPKQHSSS